MTHRTVPARLLVLVLALLCWSPAPAAAQSTFGSTLNASCVGAGIGCQQVDFFLSFTNVTEMVSLDYFSFVLTSPGWIFSDFGTTEAEDALGFNFYTPTVASGGGRLDGTFDFGAVVDPTVNTLRVRTEFTHAPDAFADVSALTLDYEAGAGGVALTSGTLGATVTPEPVSMILLGSGLAGIGLVSRRRRRGERETD